MACPTREEYEDALKQKEFLIEAIRRENKIREDLINKLCVSQSYLNGYEGLLNDEKEIIQKYEIYQDLLLHHE